MIGPKNRVTPIPDELPPQAHFHRWILFTATELKRPLGRIARVARLYSENEGEGSDMAIAYTLDLPNELQLLGGGPELISQPKRLCERPKVALRIADAFVADDA